MCGSNLYYLTGSGGTGVTLTEIFSPIHYVEITQVYLHLTTTTTINFKSIPSRSI